MLARRLHENMNFRSLVSNNFNCIFSLFSLTRKFCYTRLSNLNHIVFLFFLFIGSLCFFNTNAFGVEKLPLKVYTTADGLVSSVIQQIRRDSRGFLWFCTGDGLSRFDGYKFKNYTQEQGLPHRKVNDFLETKDGIYLIATSGGLSVFNPNGKSYRWNIIEGKLEQTSNDPPIFRTFHPPEKEGNRASRLIFSLAQHDSGDLYAGSTQGLFRIVRRGEDWQFENVEFEGWKNKSFNVNALYSDSQGGMWIATSMAIYRMSKDGMIEEISDIGGNTIFEDRKGRVWVDSGGNDVGIRFFNFQDGRPKLIHTFSKKDGLPINTFSNTVAESNDGRIFVSAKGMLFEYLPEAIGGDMKFRYLGGGIVSSGAVDNAGNIWFGTLGNGTLKLPHNSFITFDSEAGIPSEEIKSLILNPLGEVFTISNDEMINHLVNGKIERITPLGFKGRSWGSTFLDFQSADGEWWIAAKDGLLRYPKVEKFADLARTKPKRVYTTRDGLFNDLVFNMFEDSRGDIWISATSESGTLQRWERKTDKIYRYLDVAGIGLSYGGAVSFGEDASGNVWISFFFGGLVRYRNNTFQFFGAKDGIPPGYISDFTTDAKGRLWIATTSRGLFRVDEPNADAPMFVNFSTAQGLLSNEANCLTKDKFGRIYIGTGRGLNQLNPETNNIKVFTQADGLPGNYISHCRSDNNGILWITTTNSLVRFVPESEVLPQPPPIFIDGFSVNGVVQNVSELGETEIKNVELSSDQRQIQIDFFSISFDSGEKVRFQYKLEGQEWSTSSEQRSVSFNLSSGNYKFSVRAVSSSGVVSQIPSVVYLSIARPFWQRWWFVALMVFIVGVAVFGLDRYRVSKTRQVETALTKSKESEERFRTLADTASDAILTIDEDSNIIFVNQAIERVFGYKPHELIGQKMTMLMPERMRGGHNAGITRYLETGKKNIVWEGVSLPGLHKEGHEIPLEVSFGEFDREGKHYFTGIARDVSERKRAEEALRRSREERMAEIERVRVRIATDLHDDIGSSLTQIAVLSEVARSQASENSETVSNPLERISSVSKELVAVMSDVVWAINPRKDNLHDLVQRMRRFASDVFTGRGIKFEFHAPDVEGKLQLGANIRREVFAIFKESVNNCVKYSKCNQAKIDFQIEDDWLILQINDDGNGFDAAYVLDDNFSPDKGGNGLANMRRRARELGGQCEIISSNGNGTCITLKIPLHNQSANGNELPARIGGDTKGKNGL